MKENIGPTDRIIRFVLAIFFLVMAWSYGSFILFAISIFLFYEAYASWCALYQFLGKNTCDIEKKP